jgi:hypothetical protein
MHKHIQYFLRFVRNFATIAAHAGSVLVILNLLIFCGGIAIWMVEDIELEPAIYLAFITGLTVGYGDIHPVTTLGHVISVSIGFVGTVFVGLVVAISTRALAKTIKESEPAEQETNR